MWLAYTENYDVAVWSRFMEGYDRCQLEHWDSWNYIWEATYIRRLVAFSFSDRPYSWFLVVWAGRIWDSSYGSCKYSGVNSTRARRIYDQVPLYNVQIPNMRPRKLHKFQMQLKCNLVLDIAISTPEWSSCKVWIMNVLCCMRHWKIYLNKLGTVIIRHQQWLFQSKRKTIKKQYSQHILQ